jgi:hypothetical protein
MNVIKKIFEGNFDEEVHRDFLKFGRGEYSNKYLLEGKKQKDKFSIKAGPEFANFLVKKFLEKVSGDIEIKGIIVSTIDLREEISFNIVKAGNFQGIRKLNIDTVINPLRILELMEKHSGAFFALSFKGDSFVLKVKAKAPKSGKPGKKSDDGPKADFCSLKTTDKNLVDELFFGVGDFNEVSISHQINVKEIIYPEDMDSLKPLEIREQSKRGGILIRNIRVDGLNKISETKFIS